jgi:hypothetical protein
MPPAAMWTQCRSSCSTNASAYFEQVPPTQPDQPPEAIPEQTINRNWTELVQELRSTQTGVQVLTGFLLTVPFSDRFDSLDDVQLTAYLLVLSGSVGATAAILSPIAYHRILFRRGRRPWLVETANKIARTGLVLVALTTCGVVFLTFDLAVGRVGGVVASITAFLGYLVLWVVVPLRARP